MSYTSRTTYLGWALLAVVALSFPAHACNTPVFRFALERWEPDAFELIVLHRGDLNAEQQARVKILRGLGNTAQPPNLAVEIFDLKNLEADGMQYLYEQMPELVRELAENVKPGQAHALALLPDSLSKRIVLWSGTLEALPIASLIDSPVRRDVARRLLKGTSVVWVQVDGSDATRNAKVFTKLQKLLTDMEKELTPEQPAEAEQAAPAGHDHDHGADGHKGAEDEEAEGGVLGMPDKPIPVKFDAIRVARGDAAEAYFLEQLYKTNPGTSESKEALVFPIFGRGRVLECLPEEEVRPDVVSSASYFLTGACSCEIKAQNPGFDLLMSVSWDEMLGEEMVIDKALPPLAGAGGAMGGGDGPKADTADASHVEGLQPDSREESASSESTSLVWLSAVAAMGLLGLAVIVGTLVLRTRSS